ncbi:unnamed protein product [Cylindrotheca closterium]|uniref:Uncharacterized protein n=1 Tax=Cylindrotheca closterium TaxID=2856 RepID=A0AAD2FYQ1_9STRA|nr:unnamed protein product [Cylindrotheca closterium]
MNIQAAPTSHSNLPPNVEPECRPKGKSVIPAPRQGSKEYPKEKFYSFHNNTPPACSGVDKFLNTQFGEMDLNSGSGSSSSSSSSSLPNNSLLNGNSSSSSSNFSQINYERLDHSFNTSLLSHDLPKILEDNSMHDEEKQQQQILKRQIVLPDVTKFCEDTDSDSSDDDSSDDDGSCLSDGPLNDDVDNDDEAPAITRLSEHKSEHSLYERRESSDDGSDWEEDSCGDDDEY